MATENNSSTDSSTETVDTQSQQDQSQSTSETEGNGKPESSTLVIDDSTQLPETHPLVKSLAAMKDKQKTAATELAEARAQAAKTTELETQLGERPTKEAIETLQTRYDRLEGFLSAVGGPLARALDSRTFTRDLFETDKDIEDLVKAWNKSNPSATSQALSSQSTETSGGKMDPNKLLRIAAGKE